MLATLIVPSAIRAVASGPAPSLRLIPGTDRCIVDQNHPGSQGNKFGYEDGSVRRSADGGVQMLVSEQYGSPRTLPMRQAHWKTADPLGETGWTRGGTIILDGAPMEGNGTNCSIAGHRFSLWSPIANFENGSWAINYVGYNCVKGLAYPVDGAIWLARSTIPGERGFSGPYMTATPSQLLWPGNESQTWERWPKSPPERPGGGGGVDSFFPFPTLDGQLLAWYGSCPNTLDSKEAGVGLARSASGTLAGPWARLPGNPVLVNGNRIENPITLQLGNVTYMVHDWTSNGVRGIPSGFGFTWSTDGRSWAKSQLVALPGGIRAPMGLLETSQPGVLSVWFNCYNCFDDSSSTSHFGSLHVARFNLTWSTTVSQSATMKHKTDDVSNTMPCPERFVCYSNSKAFMERLQHHGRGSLHIGLLCSASAPCSIANSSRRVQIGHNVQAIMSNVVIANRTQTFSGALMRVLGRLTGFNLSFTNGAVSQGASGGAIQLQGPFVCTDCLFQENSASYGGAIVADVGSSMKLIRPIFRRNRAQSGGAFATDFATKTNDASGWEANKKDQHDGLTSCPMGFTCVNDTAKFLTQLHEHVHTGKLKIALLCSPSAPCLISAAHLGRGGVEIGHGVEVIMSNIVIANRTQTFSGALMRMFGTLRGHNVSFVNGTCAFGCSGAAVLLGGEMTCTDCVFEDSTASYGGAIEVEMGGILNLTRPTFRRNHAQSGGAVAAEYATVHLVNPRFEDNIPSAASDCAYFAVGGSCTCTGTGCDGCCGTTTAPVQRTVTVRAANVTHKLRPFDLGCHSDLGYSHQPRGLYSQMIYGESFETVPVDTLDGTGWRDVSTSTTANASLDKDTRFHGKASERLEHRGGAGRAAVANRGHGNEGLVFSSGETYEGYLFAKSTAGATLVVALEDWSGDGAPRVLASTTLAVPAATDKWMRLNFSMISSGTTTCDGIEPMGAVAKAANITCPVNNSYSDNVQMSDRSAHICVKCGGQIVLALQEASTVNVDFVFVQPGPSARFEGLPVLKESMNWLQAMGVTLFRCGGSFASSGQMAWKSWRGAPWLRPSRNDHWGHDLLGGFGLFEMIDMSNKAGIEPVVTTFPVSPDDFADLVEYSFGGEDTEWGRVRIVNDSHPEIFNWSFVELGNEGYNPRYVDQVRAMEARAKAVGVKHRLHYLFPDNDGPNATDAVAAASLDLGDRLLVDIHTSAVGAVDGFIDMLESNTSGKAGFGAMNLEVNAGDHTFRRALTESFSLNSFFNEGNPRLKGRAASFCMERSGYQEGGANDQGHIFFLPNMTWGQPPFYLHKLVHDTWLPNACAVEVDGATNRVEGRASAQISDDGKRIVVRYVNQSPVAETLTLNITGFAVASSCQLWTYQSDDLTMANTPSEPQTLIPSVSAVPSSSLANLTVKMRSIVTVVC